eukprot:CAMPEP_0119361488 /NCGR_PEP_ID=MMETSP1334-20130426/8776_1 /TAXON_ID=127549 /ORGANISM="Calcidiscus leptoporus, Strain RCC1130" /LENGTH=90 /DNA_ID=CAMNT_0007376509 /DNA_START=455 /DNA_END=724 /DNA_ORIENTATION=+
MWLRQLHSIALAQEAPRCVVWLRRLRAGSFTVIEHVGTWAGAASAHRLPLARHLRDASRQLRDTSTTRRGAGLGTTEFLEAEYGDPPPTR